MTFTHLDVVGLLCLMMALLFSAGSTYEADRANLSGAIGSLVVSIGMFFATYHFLWSH